MMAAESRTAVYAALGGNAAITALKTTVALLTGSAAMLAEAFHSAADTGNQLLLLLGLRLGRKPADAEHPFGHGMNVYFWAFVVSIMLFTVGGAFSIWEAVRTLLHGGEAGKDFTWAYVVLGGSAVFEGISLGFAIRSVRQQRNPGESFLTFWRESRDPTLMTVLLEDTAALVSLMVAAGGLLLVQYTGQALWDGVASAVIGSILLVVAMLLAVENHSLLIGEAAPPDLQQRIREAVREEQTVEGLGYLRTMHMGPNALLVALGVRFQAELTTASVERAVERVQDRVKDALGDLVTPRRILIEPTGRAQEATRTPAEEGRET